MRVAIVDDSAFIRKSLDRFLASDDGVQIVGSAASGEALIESWADWKPEVVILDLSMPGMGGLETLDWIMQNGPVPVIILSTHSQRGATRTMEALERGAIDFIDKRAYSLVDFKSLRATLLERIARARFGNAAAAAVAAGTATRDAPLNPAAEPIPGGFDVVLIGASMGGPPAIRRVLEGLPADLGAPVLIVQHMPEQFLDAFTQHLDASVGLQVGLAQDGGSLRPGCAYVAPGGQHLHLRAGPDGLFSRLSWRPGGHFHKPSVDVLFESAAAVPHARALAVVLTGMGDDGARGALQILESGGHTIAQDAATSAVYGMPQATAALGAAREQLPLYAIAPRLVSLVGGKLP